MNRTLYHAKASPRDRECWRLSDVRKPAIIFYIIFALLASFLPNAIPAQELAPGRVLGKLVDADTGDPLIGANVLLEGTTLGASSDLDGTFIIMDAPPAVYTVVVMYVGYSETRVENVKVVPGQAVKLDLSIKPEVIESEAVVVEATLMKDTEASLLKKRQKSVAISDAISAEAITRSGSGNAAEAMSQVTGASVVDGKYVYIRGLGERYSATMLNGAELPSADPEKKAVQMDLFPSNLLDNIVTVKTFTPDKPGNFTGGMVDVSTKSYPEKRTFKLSAGSAYNTRASLNSGYLTYAGSSSDWRGVDDGLRALPSELQQSPAPPNGASSATRKSPELANQLDQASKAFAPVMAPSAGKSALDGSLSLSLGDQATVFGRPFGYLASFSYNHSYSYYNEGQTGRWKLGTNVSDTDSLTSQVALKDEKGSDEVLWGGLLTASSKIHPNHEIGFNLLYTRSGESTSRYLVGNWPEQFGADATNTFFETRALGWVERNLQSYQLSGEHYFSGLLGMKIDWRGALTRNTQDEPDIRYFSDHYSIRNVPGTDRDTVLYSITPSNYPQPARYFRNLKEDGQNGAMNLEVPFKNWNNIAGKFKIGGFYSEKTRNFEETRYEYQRPPNIRYSGDPERFFAAENVGIIGYDSTRNEYIFGNYIQLSPDPRGGNYAGAERVSAAYGMIEIPLLQRLRFIGGTRFEATRMEVSSPNTSLPDSLRKGDLTGDDWLPSLNFIYLLSRDMNLRLAYGRTLARPTLREMAPYSSFEFVNDYQFTGNVNLERSLIDNFDLRWEWFDRAGEIYAFSVFYKQFKNPIERTIIAESSADNPEVTYANVDKGSALGVEFETRKKLDIIHSWLANFRLGFNLAVVNSRVDIPAEKLDQIRQVDPERSEFTENTRPLQGQSPYLLNLSLAYDNFRTGTTADLHYNAFGDRLAEVTSNATPDVYEKSRSSLNFTLGQRVFGGLSMNFRAMNLLDAAIRFVHEYKGVEYIRREYKTGRRFSLGFSYEL